MASDLMQLNYTIELLAPVLITGSVGDENIALSASYISGTSLHGMFANQYIKDHPLTDNGNKILFSEWFMSDKLHFLNGYIAGKDNDNKPMRCLPVPLSIQTTKNEKDKIYDLFFTAEKEKPTDPTKPVEGFAWINSKRPNVYTCIEVKKSITLHHERKDQLKGHSDDGKIYNYESINTRQVFAAAIIGDESVLKAFRGWIGSKSGNFRLGRSKNTEYGPVRINWSELCDSVTESQPINEKEIDCAAASYCFSISLLSDAILLNENGQSEVSANILLDHFAQKFADAGFTSGTLEMTNSFLRAIDIENYVSVWKARKPAVSAFRMGSCCILEYKNKLDDTDAEKIADILNKIHLHGIGLRRNEGFGRIAINLQKEYGLLKEKQNLENQKLKQLKKDLPGEIKGAKDAIEEKKLELAYTNMPPLAKEILRNSLKTELIEQIRDKAADKLKDIKFASSNLGAQISRLQKLAGSDTNEEEFLQAIKKLKIARGKLQKIKLDSNTDLLAFLEAPQKREEYGRIEMTEIMLIIEQTVKSVDARLFDLIDFFNEQKINGFKQMLYQQFLETFFALMHKKAKEAANA